MQLQVAAVFRKVLLIEANRTLAREDAGPDVIREPLNLQA